MKKNGFSTLVQRWQGKKIAIVGYGIEGQSVARFLNRLKFKFDIFDRAKLRIKTRTFGARIVTGANYLNRLGNYDVVIRSPGIPATSDFLKKVAHSGAELTSATNLYYEFSPATTIGVTGTKGKGTTSSLIALMLKKDGKSVYLGGNIGKPPLDFLHRISKKDFVVFEMSSFQLQDCRYSPHFAVVLSISSDHLDYHQTNQEYILAKSNIIKHQKRTDFCILCADSKNTLKLAKKTKAKIFWYSADQKKVPGAWSEEGRLFIGNLSKFRVICSLSSIKLRGQHNISNVSAAALASSLVKVKDASIRKAITTFKGLEHRLKFIGNKSGVEYFDDSYATQPESVMAAIKTFNRRSLVWICGGSDKGADYGELAKTVCSAKIKTVILMGETAGKIQNQLLKKKFKGKMINVKSMKEAVAVAKKQAEKKSVVLLSPASASFGLFANAHARGEEFTKEVKKL